VGLELLQGLMLCILPSVVQTFSRLALRLGCSTSPKYVVSTEGAQQVGYVAGLRLSFGQLVGDAPKLMVGKTLKSKEDTQKNNFTTACCSNRYFTERKSPAPKHIV
jgi:hypothetical protein